MRNIALASFIVLAALVGLGAQSCDYASPGYPVEPLPYSFSYKGWLNEDSYLYWNVYANQYVYTIVYFTGYRERSAVNLHLIYIPTEDFERWKQGKPVRVLAHVTDDGPPCQTGDTFCVTAYVSGWITVILFNKWTPDFVSGDVYVEVGGWYR